MTNNPLGIAATLTTQSGTASYVSLAKLAAKTRTDVGRLPHTVKILLENIARRAGGRDVTEADVVALAQWPNGPEAPIAFMPARVLMQDFTGVPAVVDLAALRSAVARSGGDPKRVNPFIPVDLIIDHSVQVDRFGSKDSYAANLEWEYRRNRERYALLNWAQQAFEGFRVVPPGMGICHQVNLEHLGRVVASRDGWVFPDTLVGTDSHTPMINGLGVLGWGVGGIEAEAAMLGQPMFLPKPIVLGVRTRGTLPVGTTATDLVLTLTQMLRAHGVVGKFVEFFGSGLEQPQYCRPCHALEHVTRVRRNGHSLPGRFEHVELPQADRPRCAHRFGRALHPRTGFVPNGRGPRAAIRRSARLGLAQVEPCVAGPKRPQDRVPLASVAKSFRAAYDGVDFPVEGKAIARLVGEGGNPAGEILESPPEHLEQPRAAAAVTHGAVVIAAITSCTNTSNPSVMIAAGLLARKAVEAGLQCKPWVKTSLAPKVCISDPLRWLCAPTIRPRS